MIVVKTIPVTDGNLVSSSIPEPDTARGEVEWVAGTYSVGAQVIKSSTHRVYECVNDPSTTDDPEVGVLANPQTWIDIGATNRWKMFDNVVGYQSEGENLVVKVTNQPVINSVSGFNISGTGTIDVKVHDTGGALVYDKTVQMIDESNVNNWWDYFFEPVIAQTRFILSDLPFYPNSTITVEGDGPEVRFGELLFGRGVEIGETQYGTGWQGLDFSVKERDSFGNYNVIKGRTADLLDYDIKVDKTKFGFVKSTLKSLTGVPTVWIGNPDDINDGTAVFGYYRDAQINFSSPSLIDLTVQVEGLV